MVGEVGNVRGKGYMMQYVSHKKVWSYHNTGEAVRGS